MASLFARLSRNSADGSTRDNSTWSSPLRHRASILARFGSSKTQDAQPNVFLHDDIAEGRHYPSFDPKNPDHCSSAPVTPAKQKTSGIKRELTPYPKFSDDGKRFFYDGADLGEGPSGTLARLSNLAAMTASYFHVKDKEEKQQTSPQSVRSTKSFFRRSLRSRSTIVGPDGIPSPSSSPIEIPPCLLSWEPPTLPTLTPIPDTWQDSKEDFGKSGRPTEPLPGFGDRIDVPESSLHQGKQNAPVDVATPMPGTNLPLQDPFNPSPELASETTPTSQQKEPAEYFNTRPSTSRSHSRAVSNATTDKGYHTDEEDNVDGDGFERVTLGEPLPSHLLNRNKGTAVHDNQRRKSVSEEAFAQTTPPTLDSTESEESIVSLSQRRPSVARTISWKRGLSNLSADNAWRRSATIGRPGNGRIPSTSYEADVEGDGPQILMKSGNKAKKENAPLDISMHRNNSSRKYRFALEAIDRPCGDELTSNNAFRFAIEANDRPSGSCLDSEETTATSLDGEPLKGIQNLPRSPAVRFSPGDFPSCPIGNNEHSPSSHPILRDASVSRDSSSERSVSQKDQRTGPESSAMVKQVSLLSEWLQDESEETDEGLTIEGSWLKDPDVVLEEHEEAHKAMADIRKEFTKKRASLASEESDYAVSISVSRVPSDAVGLCSSGDKTHSPTDLYLNSVGDIDGHDEIEASKLVDCSPRSPNSAIEPDLRDTPAKAVGFGFHFDGTNNDAVEKLGIKRTATPFPATEPNSSDESASSPGSLESMYNVADRASQGRTSPPATMVERYHKALSDELRKAKARCMSSSDYNYDPTPMPPTTSSEEKSREQSTEKGWPSPVVAASTLPEALCSTAQPVSALLSPSPSRIPLPITPHPSSVRDGAEESKSSSPISFRSKNHTPIVAPSVPMPHSRRGRQADERDLVSPFPRPAKYDGLDPSADLGSISASESSSSGSSSGELF